MWDNRYAMRGISGWCEHLFLQSTSASTVQTPSRVPRSVTFLAADRTTMVGEQALLRFGSAIELVMGTEPDIQFASLNTRYSNYPRCSLYFRISPLMIKYPQCFVTIGVYVGIVVMVANLGNSQHPHIHQYTLGNNQQWSQREHTHFIHARRGSRVIIFYYEPIGLCPHLYW